VCIARGDAPLSGALVEENIIAKILVLLTFLKKKKKNYNQKEMC
jgi:hypothetical protein